VSLPQSSPNKINSISNFFFNPKNSPVQLGPFSAKKPQPPSGAWADANEDGHTPGGEDRRARQRGCHSNQTKHQNHGGYKYNNYVN